VADKWVQNAIQNPGSLRAAAERAGAITKKGTIMKRWLREQAKKKGVIGRRARLALTLAKFRAKRTKK